MKNIFQTVTSLSYTVRFCQGQEQVETLEGQVQAALGDAVVTGSQGEQWPVPRADFGRKYAPCDNIPMGVAGQYKKRLAFVRAEKLHQEESIELNADRGRLTGRIQT